MFVTFAKQKLDFYLWGNLKHVIYRNKPHNFETLQIEIRNAILDMKGDALQGKDIEVVTSV
jgi:hypothetical protein